MYSSSARYYDAIYSWKNYEEESMKLDAIIQSKNADTKTLLDVACGTGHHLEHLSKRYSCEGIDISPEMLEVARGRLPRVTFNEASMFDFDLGKQFDAVVSLFSSIGYARSVEQLDDAVKNMANHLASNGVLVIEPWFGPDEWNVGHLHSIFVDESELKIARMNISERREDIAVMHMHHLVGGPEGIEYFVEDHEMTLFTHDQYLGAFAKAGLEASHDPEGLMGRGLYIGIRIS